MFIDRKALRRNCCGMEGFGHVVQKVNPHTHGQMFNVLQIVIMMNIKKQFVYMISFFLWVLFVFVFVFRPVDQTHLVKYALCARRPHLSLSLIF